jgi:uncharacterized protein DUF5060
MAGRAAGYLVVCVGLAAGAVVARVAAASATASVRVPRYGVFERALSFSTSAANPWEQVRERVTLSGPHRRKISIGGFYSSPGTWTFRFAPDTLGTWRWTARISYGTHTVADHGSFVVVAGQSHGFVRRNPANRYRWVFSNGEPYDPIGLQDCTVRVYTDDPLTGFGFDGGLGTPPRWTSLEPYLSTFAAAGFDLFRWGPDNCSFALWNTIAPGGNVYSTQGGAYADRLMRALRRHGFRIEFVLFGLDSHFPMGTSPADVAAVERYVKYVADRYGAFVDFWELLNETTVPDAWYAAVGSYLEQVDPYHHPVGTSWPRPDLPGIDFGSDHWYQTEPDLDSDLVAWRRLRAEPARAYGKPTLVDEQGNSGHNWDPTSAVRMRLRAWTAFFAEAILVFWNTSATKDYAKQAANIYLGQQERGYVRVLARYMRGFGPQARVIAAPVRGRSDLRAYALRGPKEFGLYLVDGASHSEIVRGAHVVVSPARPGRAVWIDPATGRQLATGRVAAGRQTLAVPPFTADVALEITAAGPR